MPTFELEMFLTRNSTRGSNATWLYGMRDPRRSERNRGTVSQSKPRTSGHGEAWIAAQERTTIARNQMGHSGPRGHLTFKTKLKSPHSLTYSHVLLYFPASPQEFYRLTRPKTVSSSSTEVFRSVITKGIGREDGSDPGHREPGRCIQ